MNNSFTTEVSERVGKTTGLTGDLLTFVSGAAYVTATLGKFPTKIDMYNFAGMTERELNVVMHDSIKAAWTNEGNNLKSWFGQIGLAIEPRPKAMIYAVASDLVADGILENSNDVDGRARGLLRTLVNPQQIQTRAQFDGYLVTLEYLRHRSRGLNTSLSTFMRARYGSLHKHDSLRAFTRIIVENDRSSFPDECYTSVIDTLVELLKICE